MRISFALLFLFLITFQTVAQKITSLTLVNASSNTDIKNIDDGEVFNINEIGNQLNIRANTSGSIGSVKFELNGNAKNTENVAPYAMTGDNSGNYNIWSPTVGNYKLTASAYSGGNASGTILSTLTVNFSFTEEMQAIVIPTEIGTGDVSILGEFKKWHKITLSFDGPEYSETSNDPNPFLDFRLEVAFTNGETTYKVPGFFAVDGNAAESSATSGNIWQVNFSPDKTGEWNYSASFRIGRNIAISPDSVLGDAITSIDGKTGKFTVSESDKTGADNRAKGRLKYVNKHHLQYAETKEYFLKGGADSPENFLAYKDFDGEFKNDGIKDNLIKDWAPHIQDWNAGDPSWQDGKGTGIIGAVNYLASQGLNAFSFLTMNIGGDDANVYPYVSSSDLKHFDVSKLEQWEVVFSHADKLGMYLHFKTQETENDQLLDGGAVDKTRKLYYRELIARFAHHLALNWNLGEENSQTTQQRKEMAQYFFDTDPYKNHIVVHTFPNQQAQVYSGLLGNSSKLTGASIQTNWNNVYSDTKKWVDESAKSGKRWVVANDEQGSANTGVPHNDYKGTPSQDQIRKETLWGNLMAGGAGVEYYFGYQLPESDLNANNYRIRSNLWKDVKNTLQFFRKYIPFQEMVSDENLVSNNAWCLAKKADTYLLYLKDGGTTSINLSGVDSIFQIHWYSPKNGGELQTSNVKTIAGNGLASIGNPPSETSEDWAVLLTKTNASAIDNPLAVIKASERSGSVPLEVYFDGRSSKDNDSIVSYFWEIENQTITGSTCFHTFNEPGSYTVKLSVTDNEGKTGTTSIVITAKNGVLNSGCGTATTWKSVDFNQNNSNFYIDNYTGTPLLAIQPNSSSGTPVSASVEKTFTGESCSYNLIFHGVGESDGQAEFKIYVNGVQLGGNIVLPLSSENWEIGENFNMLFEGVALINGDVIRIEGKTASADGKEWSRARWLKLEILPINCEEDVFVENEGYVVVEAESVNLASGWKLTNSFAAKALGEGHLEYVGGNSYGSVPENSILTYKIKIQNPGIYQFKWRSRNGKTAAAFDQENDSWLKIEADEYYGKNGNNKTIIGDHFAKVWIQNQTAWSWNCKGEYNHNNGLDIFARFDNPGIYKVQIAGRSKNHPIDRFVLYKNDKSSKALNLTTPESPTDCDNFAGSVEWASPIEYEALHLNSDLIIDGQAELIWEQAATAKGNYESSGKALPAQTDLSFTFKSIYDELNLYLFVTVKDEDILAMATQNSSNDFYDNVQLFINPDNQHNEQGNYGSDALAITTNFSSKTKTMFEITGNWHAQNFDNFKYTFERISDGYSLEAQIPWEGLIPSEIELKPGQKIGFDIAVNDADIQTRNHLSWANNTGIHQAKSDTRKFGTLLLSETTLTSTPRIEKNNTISVFPNPAHEYIYLKGIKGKASIEIISSSGYKVMESKVFNFNNNLNISQLKNGIYILRVKDENLQSYHFKILKK